MASVAYFRADAENLLYEIERRCNEEEKNATSHFVAARDLQRIFRGYITRKHIQMINKKATCIQKNWRAFVGRSKYAEMITERYEQLCKTHYGLSAITIQRHWKGYRVRTKVFSFFKLRSWLEFIHLQNIRLKSSIKKYRFCQNKLEMDQREEESKQWIVYILFKLHHLLRTHQISGIYSLPRTSSLSDIEKMLKTLKYKDFMTFYNSYKQDMLRKNNNTMPSYFLQNCKYSAHFEREWHEHLLSFKEEFVEPQTPADKYTRYELHEGKVSIKEQN